MAKCLIKLFSGNILDENGTLSYDNNNYCVDYIIYYMYINYDYIIYFYNLLC